MPLVGMPSESDKRLWPAPEWVGPEELWRPNDYSDVRMVRLTNPADIVTFGRYKGHSAGRYQHWVCDTHIWDFYTLLDERGFPHTTIHAKEAEWWNRPHPDDRYAMREQEWLWGFGPSPVFPDGKAKFWLKSTAYEDYDTTYGQEDVIICGRPMVIMGVGHRDKDKLWEFEKGLVDEWFSTLEVVKAGG